MIVKTLKDYIVKDIIRLNKKHSNKLNLRDSFIRKMLDYATDKDTLKMYETLLRYDQEKPWVKEKRKK